MLTPGRAIDDGVVAWRAILVSLLAVILVSGGCGGSNSLDTTSTSDGSGSTSTILTTTTVSTTTSTTTTSTTTTSTTTTSPPTTVTTLPTSTTSQPGTTTPTPTGAAVPVWKGVTTLPLVALTFDAGSDRGHAEEILDLLAAKGIRATFGMTGRWAEANPDLLHRMIDEGHTLMNHTYDHPHMETLTTDERLEQLERAESVIFDLTGVSTKPYFRPPYGAYNNRVLTDVGAAGYRYSVMWTVDSLGWKGLPTAVVIDRCLSGAQPGAIFLLHVGAASTDYTALPAIISGLTDAGYQYVTIPELIP